MKFFFLYLITFFSFTATLYAQNACIKGKVVSQSGKESLPGVNIIQANGKGVFTDHAGLFSICKLEKGTLSIILSFIGYEKKIIENIEINSSEAIIDLGKIELKETSIQIPEINVVSTYSSDNIFSNRQTSTSNTISKKELELTRPIGTEETLKKVAGINVSGDMGISNRLNIGIRGSYPRRSEKLLVLEDGSPIAPAPYLAPEMYYNPPTDRLDGIEIIKGADILTYGSNTMYGVVNYITKLPPSKPSLGIHLSSGENGYMSQLVTYGGTWNHTGAELQILNKSFDGFQENSPSNIFNTTLKLYSEISKKQSIYFKLNYHQEKSKASYSSLTPFTYNLNPKANPFDADDLTTFRYAVDLGHHLELNKNWVLSTKIYATQFQRDWWRQENTLIKAKTAKSYLGEEIINERYSYLPEQTFGDNDWIRVGRVVNGRESTRARNRLFKTAGFQETVKYNWQTGNLSGKMEIGGKVHLEQFNDIEITNDSSRFARSGKLVKDNKFTLWAASAYIKHTLSYKKINITPTVRYENIEMHRFDQLAISQNPLNNGTPYFGSTKNTFNTLLGGMASSYHLIQNDKNFLTLYGGLYQGYTPPTSGFGFLSVNDGLVNSKPKEEDPINIKPETSFNFEAGTRGYLMNNFIATQFTWFSNNISNFYSAGRSEAFQSLGKINISGAEMVMQINLHNLLPMGKHELTLGSSATLMKSKILGGTILDGDLLKAKHTDASKQEIIDKINAAPLGYLVYVNGANGSDSLISRPLETTDFNNIKKIEMVFGQNGIKNNHVPYVPQRILNFSVTYSFKGFSIGGNYNLVESQYTDYINLNNETAEGAMGKLPSYHTLDASISYHFLTSEKKWLKGLTLYMSGKNLNNQIYMASRLHRVASGIMPGGFRQVIGGIKWNF
ncbi:MAG: TonB-dependent receptor [Bacteroidetes bacterium]|nr:TonB-dependent receptor [Bacteroidota bacterium]NOG95615.1 TonB-dependent receptor [Bacteroidota bacterium]GIK70211.1 MAG: hypothetical protein BroJett020_15060 [Bacteroidota bacterium]